MSDSELLQILHAQGQQFLQHFSLPPSLAQKSTSGSLHRLADNEEEWGGIEESSDSDSDSERKDPGSDFEQEDDDFVAGSSSVTIAPVVVFAQPGSQPKEKEYANKPLMKAFMSSKISKNRSEQITPNSKKRSQDESEEEESSNTRNDAMLHKLVHTKLLAGSLNPDLNLTGPERKKALAGRVLELVGNAKLGKGEHVVRSEEHRRAAKRVREGISDKKRTRQTKELEEAKNLGNYHPALKKLFEASSSGAQRKREQGMKMGVGRFKNGSLILSKADIQAAQGSPPNGNPSKKRRR